MVAVLRSCWTGARHIWGPSRAITAISLLHGMTPKGSNCNSESSCAYGLQVLATYAAWSFPRSHWKHSQKEEIHKAYQCKVRLPWWRVPLVEKPDFLYTYMNYDRPRLIRNDAGAHVL